MPDAVLGTLLILFTTQQIYEVPHFADKETESGKLNDLPGPQDK
jgi:hypothetical protein